MMLDRNRRLKPCPERFQEINGEKFDLIFTVEERIYDAVLEGKKRKQNRKFRPGYTAVYFCSLPLLRLFLSLDLAARGQQSYMPAHVINIDIQDNHEEATLGAFLICELCDMVGRAAIVLCGPVAREAAASIHYKLSVLMHCNDKEVLSYPCLSNLYNSKK